MPVLPRNRAILVRWTVWLALVAASAASLGRYRIDNSLDDWMPHLGSAGSSTTYVIVGGFDSPEDADRAGAAVTAGPGVGLCVTPGLARLIGIDPVDLVVSKDGQTAGLFCFAAAGTDEGHFLAAVRNRLAGLNDIDASRLHFAGPAVFRQTLNEQSQRRLPQVMIAIVGVGMLMMVFVTGSWSTALAATGAIVTAQVAMVGLITWTGRPMGMTLSMSPALIMALGFSYAAHHALRRGVMTSLVLCAATTMLGIGTFAATGVKPMVEFALWSIVGLGITWAAVVWLTPTVAPQLTKRTTGLNRYWRRMGVLQVRLVEDHAPMIVGLAMVVSLMAMGMVTRLETESDPLRYFAADVPLVRDTAAINATLTGTLPSEVRVEGQGDPRAMLLETPGVRRVIDLGAILPTEKGRYLVLTDASALSSLAAHQTQWQAWAAKEGVTLRWQGVAAQLDAVSTLVTKTAIGTLPVMALVVAVVIGLIRREVVLVLVGVWVNLLPVAAMIVMVRLMNWSLDLTTLMIGAIAVGIAIDDTIHLVMSRRTGRKWRGMLRDNFRACAGSSLAAANCLMLFAICPFEPTAQFGALLGFSIVMALIGDLWVLPGVLRMMEKCPGDTTSQASHQRRASCRHLFTSI